MIWSTVAPILQATISRLALSDTTDALYQGGEWSTMGHSLVSPATQMQLELRLQSARATSWGTRYTDPGDGVNVTATVVGQRDFILHVECKSYDPSLAYWAFEYAERIRTRIGRDSEIALLNASNICVWDASDILDLPCVEDGAAVSCAAFDLKCRAGFADTAELVPYFLSIEILSNVSGGNPDPYGAGNPPNFDLIVP